MKRRLYLKNGAGFTLVEGIIATGIISTALIVGLTLAYSNLVAAQANSDRIIAGHLAREGIEVVRNIRDSNWLRRENNIDKDLSTPENLDFHSWDDFFHRWPDYKDSNGWGVWNYDDIFLRVPIPNTRYPYIFNQAWSNTWPDSYELLPCIKNGAPMCRIQKKGVLYFQSDDPPSITGGTYTPFYRRIILKPICFDPASSVVFSEFDPDYNYLECSNSSYQRVGVLVISQVIWQRGSKTLEIKVKERLYDWREI